MIYLAFEIISIASTAIYIFITKLIKETYGISHCNTFHESGYSIFQGYEFHIVDLLQYLNAAIQINIFTLWHWIETISKKIGKNKIRIFSICCHNLLLMQMNVCNKKLVKKSKVLRYFFISFSEWTKAVHVVWCKYFWKKFLRLKRNVFSSKNEAKEENEP